MTMEESHGVVHNNVNGDPEMQFASISHSSKSINP
jgi:hypothetical protein